MVQKGESNNRLLLMLLAITTSQCILHSLSLISSGDPRLIAPTGVAFLHDIFLLLLLFFLFSSLSHIFPLKFRKKGTSFLLIIFLIFGCILALYPRLLREYLIFPVNIFESDIATGKNLIFQYIGIEGLLFLIIPLLLGGLAFFSHISFTLSLRKQVILFTCVILASLMFLGRPSPEPFLLSIQSSLQSLIHGDTRAVPSISPSTIGTGSLIHPLEYPEITIPYEKIIMIVMEGVTARDFEDRFMSIENGYFEKESAHAQYYRNYHTRNLDSYTSLINMVTGIPVPYRSYTDEKLYDRVNDEKNLIDFFRINKFSTVFMSTFEYQPYIPSRRFWDHILTGEDFPLGKKFVSIGSNQMEKAKEDKVAIDGIVRSAEEHTRLFLMHELAYGHSPEWQATTGKTQLRYYDEYLRELTLELEKKKLLDRTLLVIVSDHGDRSRASDPENYRIPLLIVGHTLTPYQNEDFLSHSEFPSILFHTFSGSSPLPLVGDIFTVGSSEKWIYGILDTQKNSIFIDNTRGTILSASGGIDPMTLYERFQGYVGEFRMRYGNL